ncbi:MAG TPA: ribonuclease E/G [Stellaceae bacterium]|nr:ribonuclease E/G [Stellaceae bacterium]
MRQVLLLSRSPGELWAALVESDGLVALRLWRTGSQGQPGEIVLGRVRAMRPELPAALIDIGLERPGFLSGEDAEPRGDLNLHEGQSVIVQVTKEARADKATGLSMRLQRRGTRLDETERRAIAEAAARPGPVPRLLEAPASVLELALDAFAAAAPEEIVIDDAAALGEARRWVAHHAPSLSERLVLHRGRMPLFEDRGLGEEIAGALIPRVALEGGGALIIEHTAAATLIDVDSGVGDGRRDARASALATNLAAATTVARQVRLRSLAGPIVIDFIGMRHREDRHKVERALAAALSEDRDSEVLGWTRLGHLELVRKRRHAPLSELLFERVANGGWRRTSLTIALDALRATAAEAAAAPSGRALRLRVSHEIAAVLMARARSAWLELESRLGRPIEVVADPALDREAIDIGSP